MSIYYDFLFANNTGFTVVREEDIELMNTVFKIVVIIYIPLIVVTNSLVFWGTILCANFHTPINVMLFSLSIADLSMGLFTLPLYCFVVYNKEMELTKEDCLVLAIMRWISVGGPLVHLIFIAIDRYIAVIWAAKYRSIATVKRAIVLVVIIWTFILFVGFLLLMEDIDFNKGGESIKCASLIIISSPFVLVITVGITYMCILIPSIMFIHIYIAFNKQMKDFQEQYRMMNTEQIIQFKLEAANIRITINLVAVFFILWLPHLLSIPIWYLKLLPEKYIVITSIIAYIFAITNSFVNAPLYALGRQDYKRAYWLMLTNPPWKWKKVLSDLHYRGASFTVTAASLARYTDYSGKSAGEKHDRMSVSIHSRDEKEMTIDEKSLTDVKRENEHEKLNTY